jgi:hypothetical protein
VSASIHNVGIEPTTVTEITVSLYDIGLVVLDSFAERSDCRTKQVGWKL